MIGWITDPHLSFIFSPEAFGKSLSEEFPEVESWLITGDIAESNNFVSIMNDFQSGTGVPVYFVLGNHDYYGSSFQEMDAKVDAIDNKNLIWLKKGPVFFDNFALVGNGGWYDAEFGNQNTRVMLNDFNFIQELQPFDRISLIKSCQDRATLLASKLGQDLTLAVEKHDNIVVATHVPPFKEATWHQGKPSNNEWLPWFSSFSTGSVLANFANKHSDKKFIVLCGHTHSSGFYKYSENMTIFTGASKYRYPGVSGLFDPELFKLEINDFRLNFSQH